MSKPLNYYHHPVNLDIIARGLGLKIFSKLGLYTEQLLQN